MKGEDALLEVDMCEVLEIIRKKAEREKETAPYWGLESEPTGNEICHAIETNDLTPWPEEGESRPEVQGNQRWHIGRIAWLAVNWKDGYPIEISKDKTDLRGAHRVFAAHFLGKKALPARIFA